MAKDPRGVLSFVDTVKLNTVGQIVIPSIIRKALEMKGGDFFRLHFEHGKITLVPEPKQDENQIEFNLKGD